jgi:UDP-N-acetylmuramate--L-alanine ligase/UDP-N-acetylenolpyruvoylglucosamine reductase
MNQMDTRVAETLPAPPATFHFIGIGGIGMSGLARILTMWGHKVSGSDAVESAQTESLRVMGIPIVIGHEDPTFAGLADVVVTNKRAAANAKTELDAAEAAGARIIRRGDLLGMVANEKISIAVAGSHGKSTTSGMLSVALRAMEQDPTFAVGAIVAATGTNAEPGEGPHMVVEADEFDRSFHGLFPSVAIITSVAFDHPDIYDGQDAYDEAFVEFVRNIKPNGHLVIAADDEGSHRVRESIGTLHRDDITVRTFGESGEVDWLLQGREGAWQVVDPSGKTHDLPLAVPGRHNARNATAALAALHALGFSVVQILPALGAYKGIGRRFEYKGTINGVDVIDDYAHHPEEITAVLNSAREAYPGRRIIAIHQPHTYTRTHALMKEFASSLEIADIVVLMDIYGVGEVNEHKISSAHMASLIRKPVHLVSDPEDAAGKARELIQPNDIVMTIGAGTITQVGPLLVQGDVPKPSYGGPARSRPLMKPRANRLPVITPPDAQHLKIQQGALMSLYTTMRIGGPADYLVRAGTPDHLISAMRWAREQGVPVTVIGGGSNLLVHDDGIRGLVIVSRTPGERAESLLEVEDERSAVLVTVSAQVPLSWLGRHAAERGWSGMDWGVGLPGQVGGATVNNAGAHGTEMKDHLVAIEILHDSGEITREDAAWLEPTYRMTRIKGAPRPRPWTVLRSVLRLPKGDPEALVQRAEEHAEFRRRTQPTGACSGSLFANPGEDFSARLIEQAGLKGHQIGAMQLSPKHANWMMNTGGGTAAEARELIAFVQETVRDRFGVNLRPEIEFIGG